MPLDGVETDMVTYGAAVTALAKTSRLEEAFRLMREMSEERGRAPGPAVYEGILEAYGRRDGARAEELVAFVRGGVGSGSTDGPDLFAYGVAIAVCKAAAATFSRYEGVCRTVRVRWMAPVAETYMGHDRISAPMCLTVRSLSDIKSTTAVIFFHYHYSCLKK